MTKIEMAPFKDAEELADFIGNLNGDHDPEGLGLNMSVTDRDHETFEHPCRTAMCIGGWVRFANPDIAWMVYDEAAHTLFPEGTPYDLVRRLCNPDVHQGWGATPKQAEQAIRNVIKGKEPWHFLA